MSILEMLSQQLGGDAVTQISRQLGADQGATEKALSGALPMLVGALARNASNQDGASALDRALGRHDGSVLEDVAGFLGRGPTNDGGKILGHVLGGRQGNAEGSLAKMSGMDSAQIGKLLAMLAPLVLGALGKAKRNDNIGARDLGGMLGGEVQRAERSAPGAGSLIGSLLDADGDGSMMDDLAEKGLSMLGKSLFGRR